MRRRRLRPAVLGRRSPAARRASRCSTSPARAYFRYLELEVGPGVFVPRPETEVMTGWAIDRLREMDVAEPVVADLGTGSGAIALAIAQEVPRARVHAVEADPLARPGPSATSPAARRAPRTPPGRVTLHAGDFADALRELDGTVDLVISNPPYIPVGACVAAGGRRVRPAGRAVGRRGRAGRDPRRRARRAAAAAPRRAGRRRARRAAGRRRCTGCSPRSAAGGTPATTRTWPAATASSPRPGRATARLSTVPGRGRMIGHE